MNRGTYVENVCMVGRGALCCRYLTGDEDGFNCVKGESVLREFLDERVAAGSMRAQGDNCEGRPREDLRL